MKFEITPNDHAPPKVVPASRSKAGERRGTRKEDEEEDEEGETEAGRKEEDQDEDGCGKEGGRGRGRGRWPEEEERKLIVVLANFHGSDQGDGRETQRLEILKRLSAYYDDLSKEQNGAQRDIE